MHAKPNHESQTLLVIYYENLSFMLFFSLVFCADVGVNNGHETTNDTYLAVIII